MAQKYPARVSPPVTLTIRAPVLLGLDHLPHLLQGRIGITRLQKKAASQTTHLNS